MLLTQVLANINLTAYGLCRLGYWVPQMVGNRINAKSLLYGAYSNSSQ